LAASVHEVGSSLLSYLNYKLKDQAFDGCVISVVYTTKNTLDVIAFKVKSLHLIL